MDGKERYVNMSVTSDGESASVNIDVNHSFIAVLFAFSSLVQGLVKSGYARAGFLQVAFEVGVKCAEEAKKDGGTDE